MAVYQKIARFLNKIDSTFALSVILVLLVSSLLVGVSTQMLSLARSKNLSSHDSSTLKAEPPVNVDHSISTTTNLKGLGNAMVINNSYSNARVVNKTDKVVILTFGDTKKSQFTIAKPILDQYGFKASFFITCNYANEGDRSHLNWDQILALQQDGQDIESKGMTPIDLNNLSSSALNYEIGGSKQCLESHGIKSPDWFAAKYGDVWNNATVINAISKYYQFADDGIANVMFLHCDGYPNSTQTDCRTYDDKGKLNFANTYSVREQSHNHWDRGYLHNDQLIFQKFVQEVNSGISFNNRKGVVDSIPVVAYHIVDDSLDPSSTDINLFASEMKYLHDNNFKVLPMSDLGYDQFTNLMYIK